MPRSHPVALTVAGMAAWLVRTSAAVSPLAPACVHVAADAGAGSATTASAITAGTAALTMTPVATARVHCILFMVEPLLPASSLLSDRNHFAVSLPLSLREGTRAAQDRARHSAPWIVRTPSPR